MDWIKARLKEPTTWAGMVSLLTLAGVTLSPEQTNAIVTAGVALGGLILTFMKESGADK